MAVQTRSDTIATNKIAPGQTAPGGSGLKFSYFALNASPVAPQVMMNNSGKLVFSHSAVAKSDLLGSPDPDQEMAGIWSDRSGPVKSISVDGAPVPGLPGATLLHHPALCTVINDSGDIACLAGVDRDGDRTADGFALLLDRGASLQAIAVVKEPAPGLTNRSFSGLLPPCLNRAGRVVFGASDSPDGSSLDQGAGLWFVNNAGDLQLLIRQGDTIEVAPSDSRVLSNVVFKGGSGGSDGIPRGLNDQGEVVFLALFTDGTSAIVRTHLDAGPDSISPTVAITSPPTNAKIGPDDIGQILVTGTAKENIGVPQVDVQFDGGALLPAQVMIVNKQISWSVSQTLSPGVHTVMVQATDLAGNTSPQITRTFTVEPRLALAGKYSGVLPAGSVLGTVASSIITVTNTGAFTAQIRFPGYTAILKGQFDASGAALFGALKTSPALITLPAKVATALAIGPELEVTMHLDMNPAGTRSITISLAESGHSPASFTARQDGFKKGTDPVPASLQGTYTFALRPQAAPNGGLAMEAFPPGSGYGTLTIGADGSVKIAGALADGTAITMSAKLANDVSFPIAISGYASGSGGLYGVASLVSGISDRDVDGPGAAWLRPVNTKAKQYPDGWPAGILTDLIGSHYAPPVLDNISSNSDATATFTGGDLLANVTQPFTIDNNGKFKMSPPAKSFGGSATIKTGVFSGIVVSNFQPAGASSPISLKQTYRGAFLKKPNQGEGFFVGPATGGKVILSPVP